MKTILLLSACALFSCAGFAQNHPDTLSVVTYDQKASAAVANTFSTLSLSGAHQVKYNNMALRIKGSKERTGSDDGVVNKQK